MNIKDFFHSKYFIAITFLFLSFGFTEDRVVYSIGLLFMGLTAVTQLNFRQAKKQPLFLTSLLIPIVVLLREGFSNVFYINLSLPLFTLYFLSLRGKKNIVESGFLFTLTVFFLQALRSLVIYFNDTARAIENYRVAKVLEIGAFHDHIRISIAIVLSMVIALYYFQKSNVKWIKSIYVIYLVFQFVFIHFLAARTGILVLYFSVFTLLLHQLVVERSKWIFLIFIGLAIVPIVAYKTFPSFRHRVGYSLYDYGFYKDNKYNPWSSDGVRLYSMKAGIDIYKDNPVFGVGFVNLYNHCDQWYDVHFPQMSSKERMSPHSQYIVYAASAGIFGIIALLLYLFYPLFSTRIWKNKYALAIIIPLLLICVIDVFLDSQLKLFVLGYFMAFASTNLDF